MEGGEQQLERAGHWPSGRLKGETELYEVDKDQDQERERRRERKSWRQDEGRRRGGREKADDQRATEGGRGTRDEGRGTTHPRTHNPQPTKPTDPPTLQQPGSGLGKNRRKRLHSISRRAPPCPSGNSLDLLKGTSTQIRMKLLARNDLAGRGALPLDWRPRSRRRTNAGR